MIDGVDAIFPECIQMLPRRPYRPPEENLRVGLYILQKGRFSYVNTPCCEILGRAAPAQLIGQRIWQLIHPEDHRRVNIGQKANLTLSPAQTAFRVFKPDGSTLWVAMQGVNTTYNGRPANAGVLIDMTSIRYLERSLNKYQDRIAQMEDVVEEIDLKGNIISYNEAARKLWNVSQDEIVGKNYKSFMDKTSAEIVRQAYLKVYESGLPGNNIIYEIIRKDGRRLIVEDSVTLIRDRHGHPTGYRTVHRDITEQKETEKLSAEHGARLAAIFRSVNDAIITVDQELRILEANAAVKTICGVDMDAAIGGLLPDCRLRCDQSCMDVLRQTLSDRKNIKDYQVECRHQDHRGQMVNINSSALLDQNNHFIGAVLVIRDMTRMQDLERELQPRHHYQNIIGKSKRMQEIYMLLEDLADLDTTVLLTGESGTGKTLLARALHNSGHRHAKPFVTVNCSALAESLLESELFGHVQGAFTGAVQDKPGRFQAAEGGTLLLDELGDISHVIQIKLLRVLQEKEFERVGESVPRKVNVRIIGCTNKDLKQKVKRGEFREDFYYRLKVVEIHMPPLRERIEDLPLLVEHYCTAFNARFKKRIQGVANDVLALMMDYNWPGNVRELEHVIERAFVLCEGCLITLSHLPPEIMDYQPVRNTVACDGHLKAGCNAQEIRDALNTTFWNRSKAAQLLGISRQTLYRKMRTYDILAKTGL